jgi:myosin V
MEVDALVWIQDTVGSQLWVSATILHVHKHTNDSIVSAVTVQRTAPPCTTQEVVLVYRPRTSECCNVLLQNRPEQLDQCDLVTLPHLHEASILHSLRVRYARDAIYTRMGEILISINPFKRLPALYTRSMMDEYPSNPLSSIAAPPHLYGIARAAYTNLLRHGRNQSILISGESGAGKTEATKIMMTYFAVTCGTPTSSITTTTSTETQVLQSNPILEAFGNARTVRNDNSSRFGKFIELQFDTHDHVIVGARIRTYLLEKIRIIQQASNERNFHIFYELLACAQEIPTTVTSTVTSAKWRLGPASAFALLNHSGCYVRRDGIEDRVQFLKTYRAMQSIGLQTHEIDNVLEIVAAILHMGNISFCQQQSADGNMEAAIGRGDNTSEPFETSASLLRVSQDQLAFALTKRRLKTATETLIVGMDPVQAAHTRNALAMECYRLLFTWLVSRINATIDFTGSSPVHCIGLLDIFGFEDMACNSLEQLCINYANEALQHQFNEFIFAEEQRLYHDEAIQWAFIDFPNNSACLELFERKPMGLFALLDQECLFPQGTDKAWLSKLYSECTGTTTTTTTSTNTKKPTPTYNHCYFRSPVSKWQQQSHFCIVHYAGTVTYAVEGFLVKNRDSFCESAAQLLSTSSNPLIQSLSLVTTVVEAESPVRTRASASPSRSSLASPAKEKMNGLGLRKTTSSINAVSVGTQFKLQLHQLLDIIRTTSPHYVRCMKPNDHNVCDEFACDRVVQQLRSGGVLDVARASFPVRMVHVQFLERYASVLSRASTTRSLAQCLDQLQTVIPSATSGVQLGRTRVFFRRQPYEQLEQYRNYRIQRAIVSIQTSVRMHRAYTRYHQLRAAIVRIQSRLRGAMARARVEYIRKHKAATHLQSRVRVWLERVRFLHFRASVVACQRHYRRRHARARMLRLRQHQAATRIMTTWRRSHATRLYQGFRYAMVRLQTRWRSRVAKKQLIAKLQLNNFHLHSEVARLRELLRALNESKSAEACTTLSLERPEITEIAGTLTIKRRKSQLTLSPVDESVVEHMASPRKPSLVRPQSFSFVSLVDQEQEEEEDDDEVAMRKRDLLERRKSLPQIEDSRGDSTPVTQLSRTRRFSLELWRAQQDQVDANVRALRQDLKHVAASNSLEVEQELVVQRFVTSQIYSTTLKLEEHECSKRTSGSGFGLMLPQECDNNHHTLEDEESVTPRIRPLRTGPLTTSTSSMGVKGRPCALPMPMSARSHRTGSSRFFEDDLDSIDAISTRSESHTRVSSMGFMTPLRNSLGSVRKGQVSVPRWCKDAMCKSCQSKFTFLTRRHHCRSCGHSFCFEHSTRCLLLPELGYLDPQRVCDDCFERRSTRASQEEEESPQAYDGSGRVMPLPHGFGVGLASPRKMTRA